jgi:glycosyltransferase involved in cell wall biosynthesis
MAFLPPLTIATSSVAVDVAQQRDGYIPPAQRKKILLLSDDCRLNSGIGVQSREFILGTSHHYNWVQLAGSVQHPEKGKVVDMSAAIAQMSGVSDASLKLYPVDGYGNAELLMSVMAMEKPDAILHFTDPRFWTWMYSIEREIRQQCPITYLNIWDDILSYPTYNRSFYMSCDLLLAISKQTYNINMQVVGPENLQTFKGEHFDENGNVISGGTLSSKSSRLSNKIFLGMCPHGINSKTFFPIASTDPLFPKIAEMKKKLFKKDYKFIVFYNSRNIRRKQTSTIMLAYRMFCDNLPKEEAAKCVFLLHTTPVEDAGTDLIACKEALCPNYDVLFSPGKLLPEDMNLLYNLADVTINLSDNEGFGLGTAESLMAGTPIVVSVTGGLQDQCGFVDENDKPTVFTAEWGSNSDGRYKKHGKWCTPIFPSARMLQGSPQTPFIGADYAKWEDAAEALMYWYALGDEKRTEYGQLGRDYVNGWGGLNADNMCKTMIEGIDATLVNWKGREKFNLHRHDEHIGHKIRGDYIGAIIPKIDKEAILKKFNH